MAGARAALVLLAALVAPAAPLLGQEAKPARDEPAGEVDRILEAWNAKTKEMKSFTCRFRQEKKVSFMRRPLVSTGAIAYRDRRLLWKTETPSSGFLSVDATEIRIYTPEFKTLEIYALGGATGGGTTTSGSSSGTSGAAFGGAFPGFGGDLAQLREPYVAELAPPAAGSEKDKVLKLTPRKEELKKEVVSIEITLDERLMVKAWRIVRTSGDELKLSLSEFVENAKVADADLVFDVPPDVKVVRPGAAK
jgi:outer membrane lipoprotein-sorting protein